MSDYNEKVKSFARQGAELIRTDPRVRYESLGASARCELEPGFIPLDKPPLLTYISYYPNETDLASGEFDAGQATFSRWGTTGDIADYTEAYKDWLLLLPRIPYHRSWAAPLQQRLSVLDSEMAWLPLVKCPLPARSNPSLDSIDALRDLMFLWDQLNLVQPRVVVIQSQQVANAVAERLSNLSFIKAVEIQKTPQFAKTVDKESEIARIEKSLRPLIAELRLAKPYKSENSA